MEDFVVELSPEEEMLRQVIEPLLDSEGFELVRIKFKKAQAKSLLALFVDTRERRNGIIMDNLTDISRLLSDVLDASFEEGTVFKGHYDLEVSSPGLDRPLSKRSHFKDAIGEKVKIRLKNADESGTKGVLGILLEASDEAVIVEPDHKKGEKLRIGYENLTEANIVFDFSKLEKHKKKSVGIGLARK